MPNIIEFARQRDTELQLQIEKADSAESAETVDNSLLEIIREANSKAYIATGIDTAQAKVEKLPGDIAGQYHLSSQKITIDEAAVSSGDRELIAHVLTHEAWHKQNKNRGDDHIISDVDFEEALTESATAQSSGRVRAYQEKMHLLGEVATATQTTRSKLIQLFKEGENEQLNELYAKIKNPEQALAA